LPESASVYLYNYLIVLVNIRLMSKMSQSHVCCANGFPFYPVDLSRVTDLARFYVQVQRNAPALNLAQVDWWHCFNEMVKNNMTKVRVLDSIIPVGIVDDSRPVRIDETVRLVTRTVESILHDNGLNLEFSTCTVRGQVGIPHMSLLQGDTLLIVGLHYTKDEFPLIASDGFFVEQLMGFGARKTDAEDERSIACVREICSHMTINSLRYGYVSTGRWTRFIKRISPHDGYVEISPAIDVSNLIDALLAVCWQCGFEETRPLLERDPLSYELEPEALAEPDVQSLNTSESPCAGPTKWWNIKKLRNMKFRVDFILPGGTSPVAVFPSATYGIIHMSSPSCGAMGNRSTISRPALLKFCNYNSRDASDRLEELRREASIYEYLAGRELKYAPRRYAYGDVLGFLKILALEPYGRPMKPSDVNGNTTRQVRAAVGELHRHKLLHGDIRLESFYIDNDNRVRIAGFTRVRRYRLLYDVAMREEMSEVDTMIARALKEARELEDSC
jgi:hypothetical protein